MKAMSSPAEPTGTGREESNNRRTLLLATLSLTLLVALIAIWVAALGRAALAPTCTAAATHVTRCSDLTLDEPSYRFTDNNGTLALSVVVHNSGSAPSESTEVEASA